MRENNNWYLVLLLNTNRELVWVDITQTSQIPFEVRYKHVQYDRRLTTILEYEDLHSAVEKVMKDELMYRLWTVMETENDIV